ncbi:G-protein beta WD-40 repeat-containing protein [Cynara cardunculus var. scolymus]|uniref:G-protein beta WD-40 repeat-containing protein n=1 Tax=Cynara cardunculus var. scolymus TaxID=59895 RepID=A0A103Y3Q0_CYNCS|nr:G-protein beta WD-40 repeat-containing protein [Cynara cardunculus var. scolymus]
MDIDFSEYRLRCQLRGHDDDVRGICVCDNIGIATSSRDRTIRFWSLDQTNNSAYTSSKILLGHTSFVGPLAWVSPNEQFSEGALISGGMDTLVLVWDLATGEKVQTLKGHKMQVTGITLDGSDIVSSSVDCVVITLRRWKGEHQIEVWEAHKAPIQAVRTLPSGELITGSSDTTIKLWKGSKCAHTFAGHTDTVRGLAIMPGLGILSASHDGLWALTGQVLMEMVGHTSIVYSVDAHKSGLVISGSEDGSAKIWKDGVCVQSIEHPGCVWDVKFLENGDIVTACSDGVARVWTVHQDKIADTAELEAYTSLISQHKLSSKRVGGLKLEELPGLEALQVPGTKDGQTMVVREGDNGVAYAWNMKEQMWDKIGEVVDGPDSGMKRSVLNGVQYDYVFDVDIGDGEPIRKLPYNRSDNAYDTADKWLLEENLPLSYRQQVVEFILQNSGQKDFILDSSFRDPYTGCKYFIRSKDCLFQASAYVPGQPSKSAQFDGILKKITEFNNALRTDPDQQSLLLSEAEMLRLNAIAKILKDTSHYHTSRFSDEDISLLLKLLKSWPVSMMFPVIDVLRMVILHPDGSAVLKHANDENDIFMELIQKVTSSALAPNFLTSIRAVVNLFKNSGYHLWLQNRRVQIFDAFASCYSSTNKNVQVSYSTLVLNYAVLLIEKKDEEGQAHVLSAALEIAEGESLEVDAKFRALVAIGSLMLEGLVKKIALDFDVGSIAKVAKASKDSKMIGIASSCKEFDSINTCSQEN